MSTKTVLLAVVTVLVAVASAAARPTDRAAPVADLEPEPIACLNSAEWQAAGYPAAAAGVALIDEQRIAVRAHVCTDLNALATYSNTVSYTLNQPRASAAAQDAVTVAHEHAHLAGVLDESDAECLGLQGAVGLLERLGVNRVAARWLVIGTRPAYPLKPTCRLPKPPER